MAKINAIFGKGTGKCGPLVFQINGGVQIMKEKAAKVNNPQTDAQVEQRAKLKLASQVAAIMAPAIVIPKQGLKSSRNLFIKKNWDLLTYEDNEASFACMNAQLTNGSNSLPAITKTSDSETGDPIVNIANGAKLVADKIVVAVFAKQGEDKFRFVKLVVGDAIENSTSPVVVEGCPNDAFGLVYGVKNVNSATSVAFNNLDYDDSDAVASLLATLSNSTSGNLFTRTSGITLS